MVNQKVGEGRQAAGPSYGARIGSQVEATVGIRQGDGLP